MGVLKQVKEWEIHYASPSASRHGIRGPMVGNLLLQVIVHVASDLGCSFSQWWHMDSWEEDKGENVIRCTLHTTAFEVPGIVLAMQICKAQYVYFDKYLSVVNTPYTTFR